MSQKFAQSLVARQGKWICTAAVAATCMAMVPHALAATSYNWSASGDGIWSVTSNWTPAGSPIAGDTANLGTTSTNRIVTLDSTGPDSIATLTISQSSAAINTFDLQKRDGANSALTLTNAITLGATNGGTSRVFINPALGGGVSTLAAPSITLNSGGVLELSSYKYGSGTTSQARFKGDVNINGGSLISDRAYTTTSAGTGDALATIIDGNLNMSSGTISIGQNISAGNAASSTVTTGGVLTIGDRMSVSGNFIVTGGSITAGNSSNTLFLSGATNKISGLSGNVGPQIVLVGNSNQIFQSDNTLTNGLYLRYVGSTSNVNLTYTVGSVTAGGTLNTANIGLRTGGASSVQTMKLSSNVATSSIYLSGGNGTNTFAIDLNDYTLDMATSGGSFTLPNNGGSYTTIWQIKNTGSATGTIQAVNFDLTRPNGGASVGANVNLVATGTGGKTNTLTNAGGGTIDAASTFTYNGTATTANYDKLISTRAIGNLAVKTGALQLGSAITTGTGSAVTVNSGATLDLGGYTLTTSTLTTNGTVKLTGNAAIAGATTITVGTNAGSSANLDISGVTGGSYTLVSGQKLKGSGTVTGNLIVGSGSTISPGNSAGKLTDSGNVTLAGGGAYQWSLSDAAGTAGTGWSLLDVTGTLAITATSANQFVIDITSVLGDVANFDSASNYDWTIVTAAGGITGFDAGKFSILTSNFTNDFGGNFGVTLGADGNSLHVTYASVPEPAALGLLAIGGLAILLRRRK